MALDWPAEMEKYLFFLPLSLFCLLWRLLEVLHDMLETYSFPAFQTDWGNIQRDMLQIWVKVIFHLPWQLQADYCASFLPPKPGEVLLFFDIGGGKPLEGRPRPKLSCHCFQFDFNLLYSFFCSFSRDRLCQNIKPRAPTATCVPH